MRLMVPGPAETWPEGLEEMARPVLPHYGKAFLEIWHEVQDHLRTVFGASGDIMTIPGAGTAGTEMALCGLAGKKCLVVRAGTFCDRIAEILQVHRANVVNVEVPDRQSADPDAIAEALNRHPDAFAVCMVHSETSTGILHPVREIARVVKPSGALLVVDAVSSLGAVDFRMDEWGVDICWAASQKALGCPAGLAMVSFSKRAMKSIEGNRDKISAWYLNPLVWKWHSDQWDWHPYPTSLPTPVFAAMNRILNRMLSDGLPSCFEKQHRAATEIRRGCCCLGFELYPRCEDIASPTITAIIPPPELDESVFRDILLKEHGIMIAGGFGNLRGKILRIGHMGPGSEESQIQSTLKAMRYSLHNLGIQVPPFHEDRA